MIASIDTAWELLSETLVEACKEAGWKANPKTNGSIRNAKTENENLQSLGGTFLITLIIQN